MRFCFHICLCLNFWFSLISGHASSDYDAPQVITFYHDLENVEPPVWVEKEIIKLPNINPGSIVVSQSEITPSFIEKIEERELNEALYRLKAVVKTSKGKQNDFYSFVKLSSLADSGYLTSTVVHLDHSGSVVSIKVYPKKIEHTSGLPGNNSTIVFKAAEQGPVPDLTSYMLKLEREREAKEKGTNQDNRSFLSKYWMYIVPILMFAILTGAGDSSSQQNSR